MGRKDEWNRTPPHRDEDFAQYVARPELGQLLPILYPGVFPNLAAFNATVADRADLLAILLTGIPAGIIPDFQNFTGPTQADLLRLNVAIPPSANPNVNGILGGDLAGFPNGRRVFDDIVTVELRAVAGLTIPLVDPTFTPDGAASLINDGTQILGDVTYLDGFPYLDHPVSGYDVLPLSVVRDGRRTATDHPHPHPHGPLETIDHVHGGAPALDIGGDIGALAVLLDPAAAGTELHLRADGAVGTSVHTGVWRRNQGAAHRGVVPLPGRRHLLGARRQRRRPRRRDRPRRRGRHARPAPQRGSGRSGIGEGLGPASDALLGRRPPPHGEHEQRQRRQHARDPHRSPPRHVGRRGPPRSRGGPRRSASAAPSPTAGSCPAGPLRRSTPNTDPMRATAALRPTPSTAAHIATAPSR